MFAKCGCTSLSHWIYELEFSREDFTYKINHLDSSNSLKIVSTRRGI